MMIKVKAKETKVSVVMENDALVALVAATLKNGLHVDLNNVEEEMMDVEDNQNKYIRQNIPLQVIHAEHYVDTFCQACRNLYFAEVDCWADGRPQIDFEKYFEYEYSWSYVGLAE